MTGPTPASAQVREVLLNLAAQIGPGHSIGPSDVARAIAGNDPKAWSKLMPAVRRTAVALMHEGRVVITRKGRPVDPGDFRGVYRIRLPDPASGSDGPGNSASV
jgi:hypothetical protein